MKTLSYYAEEIQKRASAPSGLSDLLIEMSADFGTANNNKIILSLKKAEFFINNKGLETEKPLSDAAVNSKFLMTPDGIQFKKNEIYVKALTSLMSNIKAALRSLENEARAQY